MFSFQENRMRTLSELAIQVLPGSKRVYSVFQQADSSTVFRGILDSAHWTISPLSSSDDLPRVQQFRSDQVLMEWTKENLLPWKARQTEDPQPTIQIGFDDVAADHFLVIRLDCQRPNQLKDCLIIEIDPKMHFYGISRTGETLNPVNKRLIGLTVALVVKQKLEQLESDQQHFSGLKERLKAQREELESLKQALQTRNEQFAESIVSFSKTILQEIGRSTSKTFKLSESAIDKLKTYAQPIEWLHPSLEQAAEIATNLAEPGAEIIEIDGGDILFVKPAETKQEQRPSANPNNRYASTMEFLNRYEIAAKKAEDAGEKITGKNIAAHCNPPVSPPAISDVLRKHKGKIIRLLEKYPGQWPTLRASFKPLQRLYTQDTKGKEEIA